MLVALEGAAVHNISLAALVVEGAGDPAHGANRLVQAAMQRHGTALTSRMLGLKSGLVGLVC